MRKILAALLAAAVLLPPAADETAKPPGRDTRLVEGNFELANDEVQAESRKRKRFKRWCRRHKKHCKRAYRQNTNQDHFADQQDSTSRVVVTGYTLNGKRTGRRVETVRDPQFWSSNGRVPGTKKRRGCGRITKQSDSYYSDPILDLHHYTISLSKFWCWRKGKVREISVGTGIPHRNWAIDTVSTSRQGDFYRWKGEMKRSGHFTFFNVDLRACLHAIWTNCIEQYHPYVRIYSHANGSYHSSGHDK